MRNPFPISLGGSVYLHNFFFIIFLESSIFFIRQSDKINCRNYYFCLLNSTFQIEGRDSKHDYSNGKTEVLYCIYLQSLQQAGPPIIFLTTRIVLNMAEISEKVGNKSCYSLYNSQFSGTEGNFPGDRHG